MVKRQERFKVVHKDGGLMTRKILVDKETGVNYLFISEGYSGGLCPLLDQEGKPVVTSVSRYQYDE